MDNFLGNNDIRSYVSALNKCCLSWMNNVREVMLEPVGQGFSNNFVADITKADGAKVFGG